MKIMSYEKFINHKSLKDVTITTKQRAEILYVLNFFEKDQGKTIKIDSGIVTMRRLVINGVDSLYLRRLIRNLKFTKAVTLKKMVTLYGKEKGKKKYEDWCYTNKISNTFQYKKEKYGWTEEQFKEFNNSRAVTEANLIKRHGKEEGQKKWKDYVETQRYVGVKLEYYKEKYGDIDGEKLYNEMIDKKKNTLSNFIKRHGKEEGTKKFHQWLNSYFSNGYSKVSQKLFWFVYENFLTEEEKSHSHFAELNSEYMCYSSDGYVKMFDFVNDKLKFVIEFNGDIYHGNPNKFGKNEKPLLFLKKNYTCEQLWKKDEQKNELMKKKGYHVLVVWEDFYKSDEFNCLRLIENLIKKLRENE